MKKKLRLPITLLAFYLLGLLFSFFSTSFFNRQNAAIEYYKAPIFWLGPFPFLLFGLAIGGLLVILNPPESKGRLLFYSTLTALIVFCVTIASFQFYDWYHRRYLANIDANKDFIDSNAAYPLKANQAFKLVTDQYKDPNDLRLIEISYSEYDSVVNKVPTRVYDIGFEYFKRNTTGRYRSNSLIIGGKGNLQFFDHSLSEEEEISRDSSNNEGLREGLKAILEDSARFSLDSSTKETIRSKIRSKKIVLDTLSAPR